MNYPQLFPLNTSQLRRNGKYAEPQNPLAGRIFVASKHCQQSSTKHINPSVLKCKFSSCHHIWSTVRNAMLCYAMLCYAMLCAMLCYAMLCYAMLCYAMLCYAMLCYAMLCYATLLFRTCTNTNRVTTNVKQIHVHKMKRR